MPNPISKEEFERWRSDNVTQTLLYSLADAVGEGKESMIEYDSDQTMENMRYKQGAMKAYMMMLSWTPEFEEDSKNV